MGEIALNRQGKCLSTQYLGSKSKLTWRCALGHSWRAIPASVIQGTWCPVCARNQRLRL
ncbi:MAG: zinc-ribbon domain-containing protein, partial [Gaiellaceae bacterium]